MAEIRSAAVFTMALLCRGHSKESFPWNFVLEKLKAGNSPQKIIYDL